MMTTNENEARQNGHIKIGDYFKEFKSILYTCLGYDKKGTEKIEYIELFIDKDITIRFTQNQFLTDDIDALDSLVKKLRKWDKK